MVVPANQEGLANYNKKWRNVDTDQQIVDTDDYLPSSDLSPHMQKSNNNKVKKTWDSKPTDGYGRPDDWLGFPTKAKRRSWKIKEIKSPEQMAREAAEASDDDDETQVSSEPAPAMMVIPNLEESDSESEHVPVEVESIAASSVLVAPADQEGLANYNKKWRNVDLGPDMQKSNDKVKKTWDSKPTCGYGRPDDWLGSPTKEKRRSWKIKEIKSPEQMAREAAEASDDDDETQVSSKPAPAMMVIANLEESDSESEHVPVEVESIAVSFVLVAPADQEGLANYNKKWRNVDLGPDMQKSNDKVKKTWDSKPTCGYGRSDDWLGSPTKAKRRSWKIKEIKSPEQMAREAAEASDDDDETQVSSKPAPAMMVIPNLEESDSESELEVESFAISSVTVPSSSSVAAPKTVVSVKAVKSTKSFKDVKSTSTKAPKSVVLAPPMLVELSDEESSVSTPATQDNLINQVAVAMDNDNDIDIDIDNEDFEDDSTECHDHMKNEIGNFLEGNTHNSRGDASAMTDLLIKQRRPLDVPGFLANNCLDHVILGCCNLKAGVEQFKQMTGGLLKPSNMCTLRGMGTKSVSYHMGDHTFLEIIGPEDDKQDSEPQSIGRGLLDIPYGTLVPYHYAVRNTPDQIDIPESLGWERDNIVVHAAPDDLDDNGDIGKWDFVFLYGHGLGGVVPSFVNWREDKHHPTARLDPQGGARIQSVQVQAPAGNYVHALMRPVQGVTMSEGSIPTLTISIVTPKGEVVSFSTSNPQGIQLPGFGDDNHDSMHQ